MKRNIVKPVLFGLFLAAGLSACDSWLDVSPKSQIEEDAHFSREGGYKDQLTGVYTQMTSLYGMNMGIGFAEVLSQNYDVDPNGMWRYAAAYDYTNASCESTISNIWLSAYKSIANLNLTLKHLDEANPNQFQKNHYALYKGEALGLRAFLHFDLMRLFACSPAMDNQAKGVPYVTEYSTKVVGQKSVGETMQLIVDDLLAAKEYLKSDSLYCSEKPYNYRKERIYAFNYYAATLTLARAYLWTGDKAKALEQANEIVDFIEDDTFNFHPFFWVHYTIMTQANKTAIDYAFTCEHVFSLKINKWEDTANYYLMSKGGTSALTPSDEKAKEIFEYNSGLGNDYRYLYGFEVDGSQKYCCKLWYREGSSYNNIYPMLRLSEAYYIAAECQAESNPTRAIALLNEVRAARGLDVYPLEETLTAEQIKQEVFKEYRKEFICEGGQLFFYYKRLNASEIKGSPVRPGKSVYVLPIPSNDVEFGGYAN